MTSDRTSGFQDLVLFLARPKHVLIGVLVALIGGFFFRSNAFALVILVPIGAAVTLVLIGIAIGVIPRIMSFFIYPNYRAHVLNVLRTAWKGK